MFQEMAQDEENKEKYLKFWEIFGVNIKLGVVEDASNKQRLSELMLFNTSKSSTLSTLQQYVDRMKEGQKQIYVLACERLEECQASPLGEKLHQGGYELVYMVDPIDEYVMNSLERFDGKYKFSNIAKEGLELDLTDEEKEKETARKEEIKTEFATLKDWLKKKLSSQIERVSVTTRLVSAPAALVSSSYGWTANMERIVKAQALGDPKAAAMNAPKKIMEINPDHVLIKELNRRVKEDENDKTALEIAELLYDTSALTSGFPVNNPNQLVNRVLKMMTKSMEADLPKDVVEEVQRLEPIVPHVVTEEPEAATPKKAAQTEEVDHDEL